MEERPDERWAGPGFAPATGERGTAIWQAVAVGCGTLMVLAMLLASTALVLILTPGSGLSEGRDQATEDPNPVPAAGEETVIVRVTGTEGLRFSGDVGALGNSRSVAGTVPAEYAVGVDPDGALPETARAYLSRDYDDEAEGTLGVELVHGGEVVREADTTAPAGNVGASWTPGDSPQKETVTVRVSGTEGLGFNGSVGSTGESYSVAGTIPQEYEVRLDAGDEYDSATAYLSRDYADESPGTTKVEMVHDGEVVRRSQISGGGGSVSLAWSPEDD